MKNEQAIIVLLAYVIGFTTAYIAFGITVTKSDYFAVIPVTHTKPIVVGTETVTGSSVETLKTSDGFFAVVDNIERVLSAQAITAVSSTPGYHFSVTAQAVSPDNRFVHYCSEEVADSGQCVHYIYEVDSDVVHPVEIDDGKTLVSDIEGITAEWTSTGHLYTNNHRSFNVEQPWLVVTQQ